MFTGIIETMGEVLAIEKDGTNLHFDIRSSISSELKVDQSVAHNGVCLTVVQLEGDTHRVTAVEETLKRSNLGTWQVGDKVNIERCMRMDGRLDGHIVQGHVDTIAQCTFVNERDGSWNYGFRYSASDDAHITVPKGSVCVNGVSLTVVESSEGYFSITIIPYTFEHTNFHNIKEGDPVNIEFDILGKYVVQMMNRQK